MLPSMRFYIVSIVSIFIALGLGIFIGFTMDTQDFVIEQQEMINERIDQQFEELISDNRELKEELNSLEDENRYKDQYIESSYNTIIKGRLEGLNVAIIETNEDYITSGIGRDLEAAGAKVINVTTLNNNILDNENLIKIYNKLEIPIMENPITYGISILSESILLGKENKLIDELKNQNLIEIMGSLEEIDYLVVCGGSIEDKSQRINQVDKVIIDVARKHSIPILGVEKSNVEFSYMTGYKDLDISTVDNVDMTIGKVAMVLSMEGIGGHYGIKESADSIIPYTLKEQLGEN